ncbi:MULTISPECIES: flagellar basal body rod protein FlgC [Thermodesulfobacterium]|jgi:flagellar basal-body rod protein FlgC|uniref:Flagellar basal-body rod protein FlgC n=1 Tax=Thermodesulfobacterium commune DSM 2178 TaxID=289377 RepID=A0A075WSQ1_9BACT|nr:MULTISPECIES: flagellar basal body rod protein FlgC [Thermodesulfobacterium]KUJ97254.1 MAG: Flagellar basal-body rod protein FlgC [Thermodesulfobacterium sp. 37_54]KUK19074.1 MAG: Flagellar basal-body rod protein FlgC [Thermodesulfobacterium commune]AIH03438.1 flagellar basal body rod protein FlgC [Thermodesulfobacterium commune DSM 2178]MBZ4681103.1 flagellar basal body rod protein FlgC [Thermodesulfobacterium sp.]MDK2861172.1 flagellar basal-body rod protein FlgC [Thermodesulfobacterium s
MRLLDVSKVAASGLFAQRTRLNVAATNIANAQVTRTLEGGPYKAKNVVLKAVPFNSKNSKESPLRLVKVEKIEDSKAPFREVYDPGHPDADARGIVKYPNVDVITEMVELLSAGRAYEANLSVLSTSKSMIQRTLELLK